jgi:DNA-binding cell septation regulator SpoVG|tara:strand:+ start:7149 stop:7433 length:285 start_codon:yes stop_codon:yes gene_type:complete
MPVRTFNISHKNIMSVHIVEGDRGLIVTNPGWEELDDMLRMDIMHDLKEDFDAISDAVQECYDITFSNFIDKTPSKTKLRLVKFFNEDNPKEKE